MYEKKTGGSVTPGGWSILRDNFMMPKVLFQLDCNNKHFTAFASLINQSPKSNN